MLGRTSGYIRQSQVGLTCDGNSGTVASICPKPTYRDELFEVGKNEYIGQALKETVANRRAFIIKIMDLSP